MQKLIFCEKIKRIFKIAERVQNKKGLRASFFIIIGLIMVTTIGIVFAGFKFSLAATDLWLPTGNDIFNTNSSGNVGIGDVSPTEKLTVAGDISVTAGSQIRVNGKGDSNWGIKQNASCNIDGLANCLEIKAGSNNGVIRFLDNINTRMVINLSTGEVGIGTTNPENALEIQTPNQRGGLTIVASGGQNEIGVGMKNNGTNGRKWNVLSTGGNSGYGQGNLIFEDEAIGPRLAISPAGYVGIGDTNPAYLLTAKGTNPNVALTGTETNAKTFTISEGGGSLWIIDRTTGATRLQINSGGGINFQSGDIMTSGALTTNAIKEVGGIVGIGTPSPSVKLDVEGGPIKAGGGFILETRTSDPASPTNGQMWLITQ